jgi:hypothetical protein
MILTSNRYQIYKMKTGKKDIPVYEATWKKDHLFKNHNSWICIQELYYILNKDKTQNLLNRHTMSINFTQWKTLRKCGSKRLILFSCCFIYWYILFSCLHFVYLIKHFTDSVLWKYDSLRKERNGMHDSFSRLLWLLSALLLTAVNQHFK